MRHTLFAAVAALSFAIAGAASAQSVHYSAKLAGGPGVKGSGEVSATLDGKAFTYSATYSGLTGPAVAAHFHRAPTPGGDGPVALPVVVAPGSLKGAATLSDAQIADINAGRWYLSIHTAANPGGEIRGTLAPTK